MYENYKMMINNKPILVTGHPRSGAGIVMGVLSICGADLGDVDKMNENWLIRDKVMKPYLVETCGADVLTPIHIETSKDCIDRYEETFYWMLHMQGMTAKKWAYKDSRILLVVDSFFDEVYPNAKYIIVRRNDEDILNSCLRTSYMTSIVQDGKLIRLDKETALNRFKTSLADYKERITALKNQRYIQEVWLEKVLDGDYSELKEVVEYAGLEWKEKEVKQYLLIKLKRK